MSRRILVAAAAVGALLLVPQALPATASTAAGPDGAVALATPKPPADRAWIVGQLTDAAGHPRDGVNVEAWSTDPSATEPTASDLTYEYKRGEEHGYYRLEVPFGKYVLVFSDDSEIQDPFHQADYNGGKPISIQKSKVRKVVPTELAWIAAQPSKTALKLSPSTIKVGKTGSATVTVTCTNVAPVVGKVSLSVAGHKLTASVGSTGKATFKLPKFKKAGKYPLTASFLGSSAIKKSASPKAVLTVKK